MCHLSIDKLSLFEMRCNEILFYSCACTGKGGTEPRNMGSLIRNLPARDCFRKTWDV